MHVLPAHPVKLVGSFEPHRKLSGFLNNFLTDFEKLGLQLAEDLQRHITAFETLAQIALLFLAARSYPAHRFPIFLCTLSDNTGAATHFGA